MLEQEKKIVIIGGGISGLSVLHFLNKKFSDRKDIKVTLLEKNSLIGGTIQTQHSGSTLFEMGPNGFLYADDKRMALAEDLGCADQIIEARESANKRYVLVRNRLCEVPVGPNKLFSFPGLNIVQKLRIFGDLFIKTKTDENESVYDFVSRRFGKGAADYLADPMVSGIFGGNSSKLSMSSAFPTLAAMEKKFGSVIKGFMVQKKSAKRSGKYSKRKLYSFEKGMRQLITNLYHSYSEQIQLNKEVESILRQSNKFEIKTSQGDVYKADIVISAAPAYQLSPLLKDWDVDLSHLLTQVLYAPIAVVGLSFKRSHAFNIPDGFGYLIPTTERKNVLGVLFESNIFTGRSRDDEIMLRVMIGGRRKPDLVNSSTLELKTIAQKELLERFGINAMPQKEFYAIWPKAIPQYEQGYHVIKERIVRECEKVPGFYLCANYIGGIAFNDCIENAEKLVKNLAIPYNY